jgi:integrase
VRGTRCSLPEGHLLTAPLVWRPPPPAQRERWLTRQEAVWLLRAARCLRKDGRHLARFILAGLYTGTRKAAILSLRIDLPATSGGWIDTMRGVLYRRGTGDRETRKRQTPARLPRPFLAHVRRWKAMGCHSVVPDHEGHRIGDIKKGWARAVSLAGELARKKGIVIDLSDVTPHVLRHTCATWLMQRGADRWDAAGYLGMSVETLEKTYGHHHPDHQGSAVDAMERKR